MAQTYSAPTITRSSAIDNPTESDFELLTITSSISSSTITPSYVKIISDNITTNQLSQKIFPLKNDDYNFLAGVYNINVLFDVRANQQYTFKAKVVYSDGNYTSYSNMYTFTSAPTVPVILSAFGDSETSIFLTVVPQLEVTSYTAVLSYLDYSNFKQMDIVENLTTTDNTKQFIEITNLLQNVEYTFSIFAINSNGQSYLSNSMISTTKPQPGPVLALTASFDNNANVTLNWTLPLNSVHLSIDSYHIKDEFDNLIENISGGLVTSHTFSRPYALNESYSFKMVSVHMSNNIAYESIPSLIARISIPECGEVQNLHITSIDPTSLLITVNWDAPLNRSTILTTDYNILLDGKIVQNSGAGGFDYSGEPNKSYSFTIVPNHHDYVTGINTLSSQVSVINAQIPLTGAPRALNATFNNNCDITLTWLAPLNNNVIVSDTYNIYDKNTNNLLGSTTNLTYTFSNQISGNSYGYYVKSVHNSIEGLSSMMINISIPLPNTPINVVSSFDASGVITVFWSAPITSSVNIDTYKVYDMTNQIFRDGISSSMLDPVHYNPTTQQYQYIQTFYGNPLFLFPIGSSYSFYVVAFNKNSQSVSSSITTVTLPIPTKPLNLTSIVNSTTPPTVSLSWNSPQNTNIISTDSYNVYQDNIFVHNVIQSSYNSDSLIAGISNTFTVKPLHGTIEYDNPISISVTPFQASSIPSNFLALPKNNSIILSWSDPTNIGGGNPSKYVLSYGSTSLDIPISPGSYSQTISGLTNKSTYTFNLYLVTNGNINGSVISISAIPTGLPIINSISLSNGVLSSSVDNNGSNLVDNFTIISYDSKNIPSVNSYICPSAINGIVTISQSLGVVSSAILIISNAAGISAKSTN